MSDDNLDIDIDWGYLFERLERVLDLGEACLMQSLGEPVEELADPATTIAYRWIREDRRGRLESVIDPDLPEHGELVGIDRVLERLHQNTRQFLHGLPANNVLLWGERGTGKSSAVKGLLRAYADQGLRMIEVNKGDLYQLPAICARLRPLPQRFILFCDDLAFDAEETSYRELKALLEGGLESRPANVLVYATSNRRHLLPERLADNSDREEIHPEERVSENLSLSDRFGITLAFYRMSRETYLAVVRHLAARRGLVLPEDELQRRALEWTAERGACSGRVARQFIDDLTGRLGLDNMSTSHRN